MKLRDRLSSNEQIYWSGKKAIGVSVLEAIFNPFLIFAFIWGMFDLGFIGQMLAETGVAKDSQVVKFLIIFFAIHLMPVWIYLAGVIKSVVKSINTEYLITGKDIYIKTGNGEKNTIKVSIANIEFIGVDRGIFDKICGTGDITWKGDKGRIDNITDYDNVCSMIKKLNTEVRQEWNEDTKIHSSENMTGKSFSDKNYIHINIQIIHMQTRHMEHQTARTCMVLQIIRICMEHQKPSDYSKKSVLE